MNTNNPEDLPIYREIWQSSHDLAAVCVEAITRGHDFLACVRIVRKATGASIKDAKEAFTKAKCGQTLGDYQRELVEPLIEYDARKHAIGGQCPPYSTFTSRYLDIAGLRLHYVDEGSGPPIVCVHGNPTWSFYFRDVIADLRRDHRVVALDHIGCGLSDKPDDSKYQYRLENRIDDLEKLLDHLGLTSNVTLVLHDWGGMIGLGAALRRPERISRLVLLNTAGFLMPRGKRLPLRLRIIRDGGPLGALLVQGLNAFARGAQLMAVERPLPTDVRAAYLAPYDSWANRRATLRFVQDIPLRPGDPSFAAAKSIDDNLYRLADRPVLLCWGERDFVFDAAFLAEWMRRFPHAEVHRFPEAGHYCLEDAGDRIVPLIRRFLEKPIEDPISKIEDRIPRIQGGQREHM